MRNQESYTSGKRELRSFFIISWRGCVYYSDFEVSDIFLEDNNKLFFLNCKQ